MPHEYWLVISVWLVWAAGVATGWGLAKLIENIKKQSTEEGSDLGL